MRVWTAGGIPRRSAGRCRAGRPTAVGLGVVLGLVLGLGVGLGVAGPAAAHVTVTADDDRKGAQDVVLTFRVPNEADDTTTVKVQVKLPVKTPLGSVLPEPVPGWAVEATSVDLSAPVSTDDGTITSGVSTVTWTAAAGTKGIPVGGFQTFRLLVGPLPADADTLAFPTVQTYANGRTASWVDPVTDPADPPESPAPRLPLRAAGAGAGAGPDDAGAAGPQPGAATAGDPGGREGAATGYGVAGLVLGALGAVLGGVALMRSRAKRPADPS